MFHLEHRFDQKAFRIAVVSAQRQHFTDDAEARLPLDMDYEIDGFSDLRFGLGEGGLRVAAHDQIGKPVKGFLCRVGMNRRQRSSMAGVEGIEQRVLCPSSFLNGCDGRHRQRDGSDGCDGAWVGEYHTHLLCAPGRYVESLQ